MINQHREQSPHVVDQFEATDMGAPFKIILKDCVKVVTDDKTGEILKYTIPDPDGLLRMVVLNRILHPRKLFGADIKFLRKAVGVMQKDMAKSIGLSAEHMCKCENGSLPIASASEKLLRIFLFKTAIKHHKINDSKVRAKIENFLDEIFDQVEPVSAHDVEDELVFRFYRSPRERHADNDDDEPEYLLEDVA
jgi:DNA-binding transcriptional regulator YiaG